MKKISEFISKNGLMLMVPLVIIMFFKTCTTNGKIEKAEKSNAKKIQVMDSTYKANFKIIQKSILTDSLVRDAFSEEMWNFLELEELADKKGVSISELKHMRKDK